MKTRGVLIVFLMLASFAFAQEQPHLILNSGGHTARIHKIIATNAGKHFISASDDKTIRVWSAETYQEERKILGQIGPGDEGRIYAIALSPDETILASAGFLKDHEIRMFDFKTGRVLQLLKSHEDVITDLSFSHDGQYLVSASTDQTVKVWRKQKTGYELFKTLSDHTGDVYGVRIFESEGDTRIVSAAHDNQLLLYSLKNGLLKRYTHSGLLYSVSVSDRYIAASGEGHMLKIFDLNLNPVQSIDNKTNPFGLDFSRDGRYLLAGSSIKPYHCHVYDLENRFRRIAQFKAHKELVGAVAFLDDERVVTGGGNQYEIYIWNAKTGSQEKRIRGRGRKLLNVGIKDKVIAWAETELYSYDGGYDKTLDLITRKEGGEPWRCKPFQIPKKYGEYELLAMTLGDYENDALAVMSGGEVVSAVQRDENSGYSFLCYGFGPGEMILSGGNSGVLEAYDISGRTIARFIGHIGPVQAISTNGQWMISGGNDQIIRLWDLSRVSVTATEPVTVYPMMNLFVTGYKNIWENLSSKVSDYIIWTEEGYFDCSDGAEDLFGFHVNRGPDKEAVFISGENLFQQFYRPDLVALKIEGKDISRFADNVNIQKVMQEGGMPPRVEWVTKTGSADKRDVWVKGTITDLGGGIGDVTLFIENVPVSVKSGGRGLKLTARPGGEDVFTFEHLITLQNGNNTIGLSAYNMNNTIESARAEINMTLAGAEIKPRLFILALAVNNYRDGDLRLTYSVNDADGIIHQVQAAAGDLFQSVEVMTLYDEKVTKSGIAGAFEEVGKKMTRDDVFLLYMAGHGITHSVDGSYYFLPVDFRYTTEEAITQQGISMNDFRQFLSGIKALKSLILLDTCNSGSFAEAVSSRGMVEKTAIGRLVRATGRATIAASSKDQVALEGYEGHGVFTYALLEAFKGKSDYDRNKIISVNELSLYIENTLPKITFKKWGYEQIPQKSLQGMDFPIGVKQ